LVWQDFMFACSMYPGDEGFLNSVQIEAEQQVKRLSHHPCMALWCGNNENSEGWERWGWQMGLSDKSQKSLQKAYDDVFLKLLKNTTNNFSTTAYWPSSPEWGRGDAKSLKEGDCHYWGVWHDAEPFESLDIKIPRFMSEFGMQSFPSEQVLNEMCDTQPCNEKDPGKLIHQKHNRGFQLMHQYMKYWHPTGEGLMSKDYGVLTQYVQAEGITMGIEAQRRHSDKCGGTLFWQLNDVWPAFSWSAMDHRFNKKPLMEQLTYAYAPYLASLEKNNGKISIYFINENAKLENANITVQYLEKEAIVKEWTNSKTIESGSTVVWKDNQIKPKIDSRFNIIIHHPQLPGGKYTRTIKGTHPSNQFLVPFIDKNGWTCQPLFPTEE
jgi:beta-mannosidase